MRVRVLLSGLALAGLLAGLVLLVCWTSPGRGSPVSPEQLEPPPYPTAKECLANGYPRQGVTLWKNESRKVAECQARKALDEELFWAGLRGLELGARLGRSSERGIGGVCYPVTFAPQNCSNIWRLL